MLDTLTQIQQLTIERDEAIRRCDELAEQVEDLQQENERLRAEITQLRRQQEKITT